ncbi:hypothetical protein [Oceanivirga salmonicida]|uniref:hypothetical protein n=1 Tax=Oceanivirga salmonicida TaxID=1769291 RepID=UPI00082CE149|nr:hypothetical protein [Oceanivirga salmonicida]
MKYKLEIHIKEKINISDTNITKFMIDIEEKFEVLEKKCNFFDKQPIEEYNPNKVNCFLEYIIITDNNIFEKMMEDFLKEFNFIENYTLIIQNEVIKLKEMIQVNPRQINDLVDEVDKLFYIRCRLQEISKYLPSNEKRKYVRLLKELSLTKYHLKSSIFNLRVTNLFSEFSKMETRLLEYAKSFGIELNFKYDIEDVKLDKIIYYKLKPVFINFLYTLVDSEIDKRNRLFKYEALYIDIKFKQDFNKLRVQIYSNHIFENKLYSKIFNNNFSELSNNEEQREQELSLLNVYKSIKDLGKIKLVEDNTLIFSIKLDFLILEALIIKNDLAYFALDINSVKEVIDYNLENITDINNILYYNSNGVYLPVLNKCTNAKKLVIVKIKNQNFAFLTKEVLYEEEIYVRPLKNNSREYIGDCLLKDTKKALVINLKSYI